MKWQYRCYFVAIFAFIIITVILFLMLLKCSLLNMIYQREKIKWFSIIEYCTAKTKALKYVFIA